MKKYIAVFEVTSNEACEHTIEQLSKIVSERSNYIFPDGSYIKLLCMK